MPCLFITIYKNITGGIVSPANPAYTKEELAHQLGETKAKVLVAHASNIDTAFAAADTVGLSRSNIFVFGDNIVNGVQPYVKVLLGSRSVKLVDFESAEQARETLAILCFSSGTTGKTKKKDQCKVQEIYMIIIEKKKS